MLRRQKHALSQSTTPFACTLTKEEVSKIENEKSAQRGSFGGGHAADIRGSFAWMSRAKTSVGVVKILEKEAFRRGHP